MIKQLAKSEHSLFWTGFHITLGYLCILTPWFLILWFYFVLGTSAIPAFNKLGKGHIQRFTFMLSYLLGFELLDRMAGTSPFIPAEIGKYFLILFAFLGLLISNKKASGIGIWLVILITPAAFYDFSGNRFFYDLINNFFGPLGLALGVALWGNHQISLQDVETILRLLWYTCLSALVFSFFKTPDYDEIYFSLKANFETTAGHSSNQVSTILGFGMFLSIYAWQSRLKFSGFRWGDAAIGAAFAFQGFLTFSRGGVLVGIIAILCMYILNTYFNRSNNKQSRIPLSYLLLGGLLIYFAFQQVDQISGGKLSLRYQGETEGTYGGYAEKDLKKITAGRSIILQEDLELWSNYLLTGVGAGASRHIRILEEQKASAHLEFSRLLAEHGIPGLIYFSLLLKMGLRIWRRKQSDVHRNILLVLYIIGLATSFHSAMRTYITPLLMSIAVVGFQEQKVKQ